MARTHTATYRGTCDASAAVRVGRGSLFITASDEDSVLRVYDRRTPGLFVHSHDLRDFLGITDPKEEEADIEGAAQIGSVIYWIGSHGRDNDGAAQKTRRRLFATSVTGSGRAMKLAPIGRPYTKLVRDLRESAELKGLGLAEAVKLPPKEPGGLSIEGLAPTREGHLLIGFRNPVPKGKALVVRLRNPKQLVDGSAQAADLTRAGLLGLGGRGIRAIEKLPAHTYLIVAGAVDATRDFRVYRWSGAAADDAVRIDVPGLADLNPEELIVVPDGDTCEVELFSDDSDLTVGDKKCKKVKDEERRSFRSLRVRVPMAVLTGQPD
jgi:Protein of unknown function (DUF3616)